MEYDPRALVVFRAVVRAGSISAGARALGWRQPSITARVQALEHALGTPLLVRSHSGVTPTPAGVAVLAHADVIVSHLDTLRQEVDELARLRQGTVRVAGFASALATVVPQVWARLRDQEGASLELRATQADPVQALGLLDCGRADIAVVYQHTRGPDAIGLEAYTRVGLADDPVRVIVPRDHRLTSVARPRLADLAEEDWVFGYAGCHDHVADLCRQAGFEPRLRHESDDYEVTQALVGHKLAVSTLTQSCLRLHTNGAIRALALPEMTPHLVTAVCRPGAEAIPSIRAVLRAMRHVGWGAAALPALSYALPVHG